MAGDTISDSSPSDSKFDFNQAADAFGADFNTPRISSDTSSSQSTSNSRTSDSSANSQSTVSNSRVSEMQSAPVPPPIVEGKQTYYANAEDINAYNYKQAMRDPNGTFGNFYSQPDKQAAIVSGALRQGYKPTQLLRAPAIGAVDVNFADDDSLLAPNENNKRKASTEHPMSPWEHILPDACVAGTVGLLSKLPDGLEALPLVTKIPLKGLNALPYFGYGLMWGTGIQMFGDIWDKGRNKCDHKNPWPGMLMNGVALGGLAVKSASHIPDYAEIFMQTKKLGLGTILAKEAMTIPQMAIAGGTIYGIGCLADHLFPVKGAGQYSAEVRPSITETALETAIIVKAPGMWKTSALPIWLACRAWDAAHPPKDQPSDSRDKLLGKSGLLKQDQQTRSEASMTQAIAEYKKFGKNMDAVLIHDANMWQEKDGQIPSDLPVSVHDRMNFNRGAAILTLSAADVRMQAGTLVPKEDHRSTTDRPIYICAPKVEDGHTNYLDFGGKSILRYLQAKAHFKAAEEYTNHLMGQPIEGKKVTADEIAGLQAVQKRYDLDGKMNQILYGNGGKGHDINGYFKELAGEHGLKDPRIADGMLSQNQSFVAEIQASIADPGVVNSKDPDVIAYRAKVERDLALLYLARTTMTEAGTADKQGAYKTALGHLANAMMAEGGNPDNNKLVALAATMTGAVQIPSDLEPVMQSIPEKAALKQIFIDFYQTINPDNRAQQASQSDRPYPYSPTVVQGYDQRTTATTDEQQQAAAIKAEEDRQEAIMKAQAQNQPQPQAYTQGQYPAAGSSRQQRMQSDLQAQADAMQQSSQGR